MTVRVVWSLLQETFHEWSKDDAMRLAAALSYYTGVSIAPLLMIVLMVSGFILGAEAAQGELARNIKIFIGTEGAEFIQMVIKSSDQPKTGTLAGIVSLLTLIWGSTNLFNEMQSSLNLIWNVKPKPTVSIPATIKERAFSFVLVLGIGFLLLVSLVISTAISFTANFFNELFPVFSWVWQAVNTFVSFAIIAGLFAAIFKILPDVEVQWRDVWLGAALTALLFTIGKLALGYYLGGVSSPYGAAGSLIAFLLWVYYSSQILFFGAEFTQVYSRRFGSRSSLHRGGQPGGYPAGAAMQQSLTRS